MKLPKVPSLVSRTGTRRLTEKQNRNVVQRITGKVAPQGGRAIIPQKTCITNDSGYQICTPW
jgi:hypothetical protein